MHQTVIIKPTKKRGDQIQPITTVTKQKIIIKGIPAGWIGTKKLDLIESIIDIFKIHEII